MQAVWKWLQAVAQPAQNFGAAKHFNFKGGTVFCSGHCLSKHKMTRYAKNFGRGYSPLGLSWLHLLLHEKNKNEKTLFTWWSVFHWQKLARTKHRHTLPNSDGKQYCQHGRPQIFFQGGRKVDILLIFQVAGKRQCNANGRIQKIKCSMLRKRLHAVHFL